MIIRAIAGLCLLLLSSVAAQAEDKDWISKLPAPAAGMGRIFIYRTRQLWGDGYQPAIYVNGEKVADAEVNRVHVIDRPAGNYEIHTKTAPSSPLNLSVEPGKVRYVRLQSHFAAYDVLPSLVDDAFGAEQIQGMRRGKTFEALSVPEDPPFTPAKP